MTDKDGDVRMVSRDQLESQTAPITSATAQQFLNELDLKRQGQQVSVPTNDNEVRAKLRQLGEPITYFGEDKGDRRDRLRSLLLERQTSGTNIQSLTSSKVVDQEEGSDEDDEFYTEGSSQLKQARLSIYKESLKNSKKRLEHQKFESEMSLFDHVSVRRKAFEKIVNITAGGTQQGFNRPVSAAKFSFHGEKIVAGDWSGSLQLFDSTTLDNIHTFNGHTGKIGGVCFNPQASHESVFNIATGGMEGNVNLWSLNKSTPLATLRDEEIDEPRQVGKVDAHPTGRYVACASHDYTWKMWDITTEELLLAQEGHSKEVNAVKFQCDGSLLASAGQDAVGRVWDLRTGLSIMTLNGHVKSINSLDFAPNGYQIATASSDNSVMIWDLRVGKRIANIPAHNSLVSDICYYRGDVKKNEITESGTFLATSSYDKTIKLWSADNWAHKHTLQDSNKILSVDVDKNYNIITGRWDRYIKLWSAT